MKSSGGAIRCRKREGCKEALDSYRKILQEQIGRQGGLEVRADRDAFLAVFPKAANARATALAVPSGDVREPVAVIKKEVFPSTLRWTRPMWNLGERLRRCGAWPLRPNCCAAANDGQILCCGTTAALLRRDPQPAYATLNRSQDCLRLPDVSEPQRLWMAATASQTQEVFLLQMRPLPTPGNASAAPEPVLSQDAGD